MTNETATVTLPAATLAGMLGACVTNLKANRALESLFNVALGVAKSGALVALATDRYRVTMVRAEYAVGGAEVGLWCLLPGATIKELISWLKPLKTADVTLTEEDDLRMESGTSSRVARLGDLGYPWDGMTKLVGARELHAGRAPVGVARDYVSAAFNAAKAVGSDVVHFYGPEDVTKPGWLEFGPNKLGLSGGVMVMPRNSVVGEGRRPDTIDPSALFD